MMMKLAKSVKLLIWTVAIVAAIFAMSLFPFLSEWYASNIYPIIATALSFFSGLIPFSLFDTFISIAIIAFFALIIFTIFRKIKISKALYILAYSVLIIVAWFYLAWGFCYFRYDLYKRCNIEKAEFNDKNFDDFTKKFISDANDAYVANKAFDETIINSEIENGYQQLSKKLNIKYPNGRRKTKRMIYQKIETMMGISGYFGPFFNEVHVNRFALDFEMPFLLAHEKAHQFGVASEAECNLFAFLVCATSDNAQMRYSAYISVIGYVLNNYNKLYPNDFKNILESVKPEIIADLRAEHQHWIGERNETLSNIQNTAYNAYLKTNKINSGTKNYSEVVGFLISTYNIFVK